MTPPVQKNHYAIGKTYIIGMPWLPDNDVKAQYMGLYRHEDGKVTHVFARPYYHEECGREHIQADTFFDDYAATYIKE